MKITNPMKLAAIIAAMTLITILMVTNSVNEVTGVGLLGSLVGYIVGNGVAAKRGTPVTPAIGSNDEDT